MTGWVFVGKKYMEPVNIQDGNPKSQLYKDG